MEQKGLNYYIKHLKEDLPAGLVVFLVALPLCLGISLASGAPLMSGLITGIVGGVVVSLLSGSSLSVSGPAAGLTVIVLNGIQSLPSFEAFLLAGMLAGIIQLVLGYMRAGIIGLYFPSSVIKGMLAAIGLILILKQIPHFLGVDDDFFGEMEFFQPDGRNTFSEMWYAISNVHPGPFIVGVISLFIIIIWDSSFLKRITFFKLVPSALIAVIVSIGLNTFFKNSLPEMTISKEHLVSLPVLESGRGLLELLRFPDFSQFANPQIYILAFTIAIVASLETLLSVEAIDKLDPHKRVTPTNRELKAQGVGNLLSSLIGGLPMTAVIVRSSANIAAGGATKMSSFIHGLLLLLSVLFLAPIMNQIPLATLAAVLLVVGYKLTKPTLYKTQIKLGRKQFIPFIVTIVAILFTDLLKGIGVGLAVGIFYILKANYKTPYFFHKENYKGLETIHIKLSEQVTFLNKASIILTLDHLPEDSHVIIDGETSTFIDYDVLEAIENFKVVAAEKNIRLELRNIPEVEPVEMH